MNLMNDMKKIGVVIGLLLLSGCTFLSREQVRQLQDVSERLEMRAELNDRARQLVEESGGHSMETSERLSIQIERNSDLQRLSASTIRELVGRGEEPSN